MSVAIWEICTPGVEFPILFIFLFFFSFCLDCLRANLLWSAISKWGVREKHTAATAAESRSFSTYLPSFAPTQILGLVFVRPCPARPGVHLNSKGLPIAIHMVLERVCIGLRIFALGDKPG